MRAEQQLRNFLKAMAEYRLDRPLSKFLPEYFRKNKQMGSADRRTVSRLMYTCFRIGKAFIERPPEERLLYASFLCLNSPDEFLDHFRPDLHAHVHLPIADKESLLNENGFDLNDVFPFGTPLSAGIDRQAFCESFFVQPDVYIRIIPGRENLVKLRLDQAGIRYQNASQNALALPAGVKLDDLFPGNHYFEVQDISSQRTSDLFAPGAGEYWWDACAGSGGKSLLLHSLQPDVKLLVSDIRGSVLNNLDARFAAAGLLNYQKKQLDLTLNVLPEMHHYRFDGIILDAPCSGSGTWGRTPEMIGQFDERKLSAFQELQKTIASNVIGYLDTGRPLVYITCSVFKAENEDVVNFLAAEHGLKITGQEVMKGYGQRADTLFAARLIR